ncbi:group I truncated hemoglobin [Ancylomarina longa]|uniref:Group 1 truncated hemoglobin n=1 Tax=Ancylomarina longa TaxID=2487017 RepID=A0A434AXA8_9BACT|nr:group 1 truncated hemoglobin [Ancylomarina longa]RUT79176.1 group 1 truncated hemoglobin [Ancylomarina longa]
MEKTLYERLGGSEGITNIANDAVDLHLKNTKIATRFENAKADVNSLKNGAATFFIAGTGGPAVYKGKDMMKTHQGMNISHSEFFSVIDDVMQALDKNNIEQREKEEVLFVLYSMKEEIVFV